MTTNFSFHSFQVPLPGTKTALFVPDSAPLVSISGGQDSIFLAWITFQLQQERRLAPTWLYHNHLWHAQGFFHSLHGLRLAFIFGWPFINTVPFHAIFDEQSAWGFRQRLRRRLCTFYGRSDVLLGHTKTDRMESFLFHLLRGSLHSNFFPDQRNFVAHPGTASRIESLPSKVFAIEGSRVAFEPPVFPQSACTSIRIGTTLGEVIR